MNMSLRAADFWPQGSFAVPTSSSCWFPKALLTSPFKSWKHFLLGLNVGYMEEEIYNNCCKINIYQAHWQSAHWSFPLQERIFIWEAQPTVSVPFKNNMLSYLQKINYYVSGYCKIGFWTIVFELQLSRYANRTVEYQINVETRATYFRNGLFLTEIKTSVKKLRERENRRSTWKLQTGRTAKIHTALQGKHWEANERVSEWNKKQGSIRITCSVCGVDFKAKPAFETTNKPSKHIWTLLKFIF